ncbi:hypothetical protein [Halomonas sp. BC04]|uniref:hypothetical protein n=1 Tax=Halomonas sp. BC04 TaxID=1403540 RepID=UPI000684FFCA|nr:hypothetical protein [Halomonas sp. BC04]
MRTEHEQILARVAGFIERHGDARFSSVTGDASHVIHNRAGWWRDDADGRTYLFTSEGLIEALAGFDLKRGTEALETAGWLVERESSARAVRIRINRTRWRVYAIRPTDSEAGDA